MHHVNIFGKQFIQHKTLNLIMIMFFVYLLLANFVKSGHLIRLEMSIVKWEDARRWKDIGGSYEGYFVSKLPL